MFPHAPSIHLGPCRPPRLFTAAKSTSRGNQWKCRAGSCRRGGDDSRGRWAEWLQEWTAQHWKKASLGLSAVGLATILAFGLDVHPAPAVTNEQLLFLEAWRAVDRAYYDKNFNGKPWFKIREQYLKEKSLNDRQETYAAIREMLMQLDDPFTRFLEPNRYAALKRGTAGSLTGVGLEVGFDKEAGTESPLIVITPSPGGPADKAGIGSRDAVVAIDGKPTAGLSLYDAGEFLQGAEGTQVTLTVQSHTDGSQRDVQLSRQHLTVNPVSSQLCKRVPWAAVTAPALTDDGAAAAPKLETEDGAPKPEADGSLGYIRVSTFSKQTTEGVKAALHLLRSEGAKRYVLDIRNNGGGLFPAGVDVARMLLDTGDIVLIADSQGVRDSYEATGNAVEGSAPLAILVNRGTASASEVLAGALHDNGRGKIVGEPTFGKGLIQTIVELSDGSGVAVTVARYQTPNGTDINKKGIQPDIVIPAESMPPATGPGFCKYVAERGAIAFFDAEAAQKLAAAAPTGSSDSESNDTAKLGDPINTTLYENALPESEAVPESPAKALTPASEGPGELPARAAVQSTAEVPKASEATEASKAIAEAEQERVS